jgi:hypothetical protein
MSARQASFEVFQGTGLCIFREQVYIDENWKWQLHFPFDP